MNEYKGIMSRIIPPAASSEEARLRDKALDEKSKSEARRLTAKELAARLSQEKTALKSLDPDSHRAAVSRLKIHAMETVVSKAPDILAPMSPKGALPQETQVPSPEDLKDRLVSDRNPYIASSKEVESQTPNVDRVAEALAIQVESQENAGQSRSLVPDTIETEDSIPANAFRSVKGNLKPATARLMSALNINLEAALSKRETADLMAALLTCNETQIDAIAKNRKTPVAVKIIIKRLKEDLKNGNLSTVDYLWDRIFGKDTFNALQDETSSGVIDLSRQAIRQGRLPDAPVSREAYILIRDTLIK